MSDGQNKPKIPEQIHRKIVNGLRTATAQTGKILLKDFHALLKSMDIIWSQYACGYTGLFDWVEKFFPEFERAPDGTAIVQKPKPVKMPITADARRIVIDAINESMDAAQTVSMSKLGSTLRDKSFTWRLYSDSLADLAVSVYPSLIKSDDGQSVSRQNAATPAPPAQPAAVYPPAEQNLSMVDMDEDIRQMHAMAFMGWWNNNLRALKRYTNCSGNDPRIWSAIVAQKMSDIFMGRGSAIVERREDGLLRVAFYAGMDTVDGKHIYSVLLSNKLAKDSKYQPMILEDFSYVGDEDNPELSAWLEERIETIETQPVNTTQMDILQLETQCYQLEELRGQLLPLIQGTQESVQAGMEIPADMIPDLEPYCEIWEKVNQLRASVEVPEELETSDQILKWCAEQNQYAVYLKQIRQSFQQLTADLTALTAEYQVELKDLSEDQTLLVQTCDEFSTELSTQNLRDILKPYRQMAEILTGGQDMKTLIELTEQLDPYFGFASMIVCGAGLRARSQESVRQYCELLQFMDTQLAALDDLSNPEIPQVQEERQFPAAEKLLDAVCSGDVSIVWTAGGVRDQLEQLILEDRLPEAQSLAGNIRAMEEAGYDEESRQTIFARLFDSQNLPEGHALSSMARRMSQIMGIRSATAERYFLMGMFTDRAECTTQLLKIYRETDQVDKFVKIWERFRSSARYDADNYIYYVRSLLRSDPEQARKYLDGHVFIYYLPAYADLIAELYTEAERAELPAPITGTDIQSLNALEKALVTEDKGAVLMLLNNTEALTEMGYSEEQITQISQAAIDEDCPTGQAPVYTGMRIHLYQGNLHRLAEYYLWEGLARAPSTEASNKLVRLLANEKRWAECVKLYTCYASASGISNDSRQAYLLAMIHVEPIKAQQAIRSNLQHFLSLVYQNPEAAEVIDAYRNSSNEAFREFYESVYQLNELIAEDFPRSVILHNRTLRTMVTQSNMLEDLDLDDRQIEYARNTYQSGNYPQGTDAASVAGRAYAFLGTYHDIAEKLARFALPAEDALALLWNISVNTGDIQQQHLLLQNYPALHDMYPTEYSQYLFNTEQYELFLDWMRTCETEAEDEEQPFEATPVQKIQQAIAQLQLDAGAQIGLPVLASDVSAEQSEILIRLNATLVRLDRLEELQQILLTNFDILVGSCSPETLSRIMTANHSLSAAAAAGIQDRALETDCFEAALYYYNTMQVGDLAEQADAYYQQFLDHCQEETVELQLANMKKYSRLYPGKYQELSDRIYQLKVCDLLQTETVTKDGQAKLAETLDACPLDADGIRQLLQLVQASAYAAAPAVLHSVVRLTEREELQLDGLVYLHQVAMSVSKKAAIDEYLYTNLCQRYLDALNQDRFPRELGDEAAMLCRRIILSDTQLYKVVYCLYRIEMLMERRNRAEYVLRYLVAQPVDKLDTLYAVVSAAVEDFWGSKVPSMLSAFREILLTYTPDEISDYCDFCKILASAADEDWTIMHEHIQNMRRQWEGGIHEYSQCTEMDGEALIKVLCCAPDKSDYWWGCTALPGLNPVSRGKLLFICGQKNPNMWKECAQYCVETEQNDVLLRALQEWVRLPSPSPKNCRAYLADALELDPNYFGRWTEEADRQTLLEVLELLCADLKEDTVNLPNTVAHTALGAISSIAVALGSVRAVEILVEYLSEPLMTANTEVAVATVLRLLLDNRSDQAAQLLEDLAHSATPIACRILVDQLSALTPEELADWCQSQERRTLCNMLLPDGNRPTAKDIHMFALNMIKKNRIQFCADVLSMLLDIFPGDYACCDCLFILCKYDIEKRVQLLHKALCGMISSSANGSSYFRRDPLWNAKMLAGVNAVIKANHLEGSLREVNSEYDFNQEAGKYFLMQHPALGVNVNESTILRNINDIQSGLLHNLANLHSDELAHKCAGILCWVTGEWTDYLYTAWQVRRDNQDVAMVSEFLRFEPSRQGVDSIGFCRSLLRVIQKLEKADRLAFLQWVHLALTGHAPSGRVEPILNSCKKRQLWLAYDLFAADVLDKVGDLSVMLPLEETSLMPMIYEEYIEPYIGQDPELLFNRLWLLGAVVDHPTTMYHQFFSRAQMYFRQGEDENAAVFYEAMLRLLNRGLVSKESVDFEGYKLIKEQYQAYARISRLMLEDKSVLNKVRDKKFNVWSCINMTVAMMCTPRGNQAMQMVQYFNPRMRFLGQSVIRIVAGGLSDQEKMRILQNYPNGIDKAYLAHLLRLGNKKNGIFRPSLFKNKDMSRQAKEIFLELIKQFPPEYFPVGPRGPWPERVLITTFDRVHAISAEQLPVRRPEPPKPMIEEPDQTPNAEQKEAEQAIEVGIPFFAADLAPLETEDSLEVLEEAHSQLPHLRNYFQERLQLSEQLYRMVLAKKTTELEKLNALIRFGLDYYDYHMALNSSEEFSQAYRAIVELVLYVDSVKSAAGIDRVKLAAVLKPLETAVENPIMYTILEKSQLTIQGLIGQFAQDRKAFGIMQSMVTQDNLRKESLRIIYSALDHLVEAYSVNSVNSIVLRAALNKAQEQIGRLSYGAWLSLKNRLQNLIQTEVNSIDCRPILDLEIQNKGRNAEEDYIYGEISNVGMETATDITIQVAYDDSSSGRMRLSVLPPSERAAFKVRYTAPEGAQSLHYKLTWSYVFNGQTFELPIKEDTLAISPVAEPTFPVDQYETQTITDFFEDENGVLTNPNFFGRDRETEKLRNLFRSGRFPSYNNAIVYGIRRAGKTTLLNYVMAYVRLHCPDANVIKVDCLINTSSRLVQTLFIDRVLDGIRGSYPQYTELEGWQKLEEKWTLPEDSTADLDPNKLELFYQELKHVTGKGLVLMLDEVDNFFTSVEQQTSLDSHLFRILSNMLGSASCQEAVHFIFCGSKYLLRYQNSDGGLHQLFQRFGSNIIEVGLIPRTEMEKMLRRPYEAYSEVDITDAAIDWIWEYTQGQVWHTKLLANMVLQEVRDHGRSIVYPVDVKDNIHKIVQKAYCQQFFDGINEKEKDKQERLVVDLMQSLAVNRSAYIPRRTLVQILTSEGLPQEYRMTLEQIDNALDTLIRLKLVNYSEADKGYRFAVDLYRQYFRVQTEYPSIFKKPSTTAEQSFVNI